MVDAYLLLSQNIQNPLDLTMKVAKIMPEDVRAKEVIWQYEGANLKYQQDTSHNAMSALPKYSIHVPAKYQIKARFRSYFDSKLGNYDAIINNYHLYGEQLKRALEGYEVTISSLPSNFSFDGRVRSIPIEIEVTKSVDPSQDKEGA